MVWLNEGEPLRLSFFGLVVGVLARLSVVESAVDRVVVLVFREGGFFCFFGLFAAESKHSSLYIIFQF